MLSRLPWTPAPENTAKAVISPTPRRINKDRRRYLIEMVARIMRDARDAGHAPTLLNLEGPIRQGLRSRLCLQGWSWADADTMAADIVAVALHRNGAKRPTWVEGQTAAFQDGASIPRERCLNCKAPLLGEIGERFCSRPCKGAWRIRINEKWIAETVTVETAAKGLVR